MYLNPVTRVEKGRGSKSNKAVIVIRIIIK